jgi:cytochrome c2
MNEQGWAGRGKGWVLRSAWSVLGLGVVLMVPVRLSIGRSLWLADPRVILMSLIGGLGYLGAVAATGHARADGRLANAAAAALSTVVVFGGLATIPLVVPQFPLSRLMLLAAAGLTLVIVVLPELVPSARGVVGVALFGAGLAVAHFATGGAAPLRSFTIDSQFYLLRVDLHRDALFEAAEVDGGGLASLGDDAIWMSGDGTFAHVRLLDGGVEIRRLSLPSPVNRADFVATADPSVFTDDFRAIDAVAEQVGDSVRLHASHHHWHADRACFVLRVSVTTGDSALEGWAPWRPVFETTPCLSIDPSARGPAFAGGGGRMARVPGGLLVTVGDHARDGLNFTQNLPQDDASEYGKIVMISPDAAPRIVSKGHRNPQGLTVDPSGRVWSTEHGPRGGDELNLIRDSANYGWPLRTLGTEYGLRDWPLLEPAGVVFTEPALAWVPSIGVSSAIAVSDPGLPAWTGDLLVGSLKARTIFRVRLDGDRPVYTEPIDVGHEVRDLAILPGGRILVWTDERVLLEISATTDEPGGAAAVSACTSCHTFGQGQPGGIGPNLFEVVGRRVGAMPGYRYSAALEELGGRWSRDRLDAYLADPAAFAPGTTMDWPGLADPDQRRSLIEYLATAGIRGTGPPP